MREEDSMSEHAPPPSGWVVGGVAFAGVMMIMIGVFQSIAGISAISEDEVFVATSNYVFDIDITAWGWIHLIIGIVVGLAGLALLAGKVWGGVVGIAVAALSAVANFFWIPYYPFWSILTIALAVWVIWALTRPDVYRRP
jgi:hypothetical protein